MTESSKKGLSVRGKGILALALSKLELNPPKVPEMTVNEMFNTAVYHKTVGDIVVEEMRKKGYKVTAPSSWTEDFKAHTELVERLRQPELTQSDFKESIKQARERLEQMKVETKEDTAKSDEEWEDVDMSRCSNKSSSSKGLSRSNSMLNAKKSMKQAMQDSAKKSMHQSSKFEANKSTKLRNNASSSDLLANQGDRPTRGLKRQASTVVASDPKKDKKSMEVDRTGFARSQNLKVQKLKEQKEMKEKERKESIKVKAQQKQVATKENKTAKPSKASQKAQSSAGRGAKVVAEPPQASQASRVENSAGGKGTRPEFLKPAPPAAAVGRVLPLDGSMLTDGQRFHTMQSKAMEDRRHGGLAKQAMFQSILAAGDDNPLAVNSTFLPGVESQPDFDASLAINGAKDTFVVGPALGATFVSKPGLVQSPAKKNPNKEVSFVDSFNETYRDYGLDDLCSDSDNTDDEDAPLKRVPMWAELKTPRFKLKVSQQHKLGTDIYKYGLKNIYMPPSVDLEMIFDDSDKRLITHNTSSGIWNQTEDFIRH